MDKFGCSILGALLLKMKFKCSKMTESQNSTVACRENVLVFDSNDVISWLRSVWNKTFFESI